MKHSHRYQSQDTFQVFALNHVNSFYLHIMLDDIVIRDIKHVMYAHLKGLAQAKIIKKSVILFRVLNMTI